MFKTFIFEFLIINIIIMRIEKSFTEIMSNHLYTQSAFIWDDFKFTHIINVSAPTRIDDDIDNYFFDFPTPNRS